MNGELVTSYESRQAVVARRISSVGAKSSVVARSKCMLDDVPDRLGRARTGFSGRQATVRPVQAALSWLTGRECSTSRASGVGESALRSFAKLSASARRVFFEI